MNEIRQQAGNFSTRCMMIDKLTGRLKLLLDDDRGDWRRYLIVAIGHNTVIYMMDNNLMMVEVTVWGERTGGENLESK